MVTTQNRHRKALTYSNEHGAYVTGTHPFDLHDSSRAGGIPPQFAEALRRGTGARIARQWQEMGAPNSLRAAKRRAREASLLEHTGSNPTPDAGVLKVCTSGCRRCTCPGCRQLYGKKKRDKFQTTLDKLHKQHDGKGLIWMWTLTTDQESSYASPQECHQDITQNERIRKLCKAMGWKYWTWVLEWHVSGWPHWHLLVYTPTRARIEKSEVEAQWKPGFTKYKRSDQVGGPIKSRIIRAANYVTKYLTKPGESPVPDWILDSKQRIRMCSSSRPWSAVERGESMEWNEDEASPLGAPDAESVPECRLTHREAIANCGSQAVLLREYVNPLTGELCHEYLGTVNLPYRTVRGWISRRLRGLKNALCTRHARIKDKTEEARQLRQFLDPHMI